MIFKKHPKAKWFFLSLAPFVVLAALLVFFELKYSDKYYPGIIIAGESVGGRTYNEVLQEFKEKSDTLLKNGLTLVFEKGSDENRNKTELNIPATTTGFTPDILVEYFSIENPQSVVSSAYQFGRKGNIMQKLKEQFASLYGKNFSSPVSPHKEAIQSLLSRETKYLFKGGLPAQFSVNSNEVIIAPEKLGDDADIEKIVNAIIQKFESFETSPIVFNIQPKTPYPTEDKLKPFLEFAKKITESANLRLHYQNYVWKISGKTLTTWLTLKSDNEIAIDNKKLETFLSKYILSYINDPPKNSRFEMKDGSLIEIFSGKSGNTVNTGEILGQINGIVLRMQQSFSTAENILSDSIVNDSKITFDPKDNTINIFIKTIEMEPEITKTTVAKYNIKDLIGYAETNFTGGSLNRQHNIEVGVSKLTGILIAPGEEFSTVKNIGDVTEEAGFVKEYVIKGDQTVKELGGGLCQLATTLFRTALSTGLPITERINHEYVIPYYGPGLDATIYEPHPDFRFVNDTGNYILLQGMAKNNKVVFELYGTSDGRTAEVSAPILSDKKPVPGTRNIMTTDLPTGVIQCQTATHEGITADTTYIVHYPDGSKKEEVFHSVYQPWPKVCLIGI
jgi:vancomycin resistance protein YoaR